jgi:hypothetical protein
MIGEGATICFYSDRKAGTIISLSGKTLVVQLDKATLKKDWNPEFHAGGFCGHVANNNSQEYDYERDANGAKIAFTLRKNGKWVRKGESMHRGTKLIIGQRREFYDYNF